MTEEINGYVTMLHLRLETAQLFSTHSTDFKYR